MTISTAMRLQPAPAAGQDHSPVAEGAPRREDWAELCLERPFAPESGALASFLINAACLVGNHRILAEGGLDPEVTEALTRMGHRVDAAGPAAPRTDAGGRHDRAVSVARALGYGSDAETLAWLRNMRKTLAPGGLLVFHVLDRDRAWNLVGESAPAADGGSPAGSGAPRVRTGFDPATGRFSIRSIRARGTAAPREARPACGPEASVRAYNLLEIGGLLEAAGFALDRAYGDWDGSGPAEGGARTGRLIIVAGKPRVRRRPRSRARTAPGLRG